MYVDAVLYEFLSVWFMQNKKNGNVCVLLPISFIFLPTHIQFEQCEKYIFYRLADGFSNPPKTVSFSFIIEKYIFLLAHFLVFKIT